MVYTITLTNPLASGHDGSWPVDLLMECVVGTPAETPVPVANGNPPPQAVGRDQGSGDGGVGGAPTGANGSVAGASADARSSQQQPPVSDNEEVDDISSDEDDDDDGGDGDDDGGSVPDTSAPQEADHMDAPEISEDEDVDDDDSMALEDEDVVIGTTLHQTGGTEPQGTAAGEVTGGVGGGVRTDSGAAVDMTSSGAKERDQPQEDLELPSRREDTVGVESAAKGTQNGAVANSTVLSKTHQMQQQQQQQQTLPASSSEDGCSSEDEPITKAVAERRKQPGLPTVTQLPGLNRSGDAGGRQRSRSPLAPSPPPSPQASPARSLNSSFNSSSPESVVSQQTEASIGDDSDSAFDGSDENSGVSEGETDDDDSEDYDVDILPPTNCFSLHQDRKTYKKALCKECYTEYEEALKKVNLDMSDIDSDTGRPIRAAASRRRKKKRASGGGGSRAGGLKRPRKSRRSSNSDNSSGDRRKRRKVVAASSATTDSAPSPGRRLVKPHRKKAKKLPAGEDEAVSNAMLLEDTTSSSSEGGGEGEGAPRRGKRKNKRVAEKPHTNRAHSIARKKKQGSGSEGSGMGVDLLGALIGNTAPARKKTNLSTAAQAAPAPQLQGKRPKLEKQRSADAVERRCSGGGELAGPGGSDGRGPPQLARGGSLDSPTSSLSLSQYRGAVLRKDMPGDLPNSSSRKPGKSVAGSKAVTSAPNGGVGKKAGVEHARRGSKTPVPESSTNTTINRGISKLAPTTPVPAPSNKIKDKYEKVNHYRGVYRKKSNGKYFVWVDGAPLDGTPYETATECAKAYDQLYPSSARGNPFGPRLNFSDARAPSHVESDDLTPLVGTQGSRISKATLTSGYKPRRSAPFFAPTEAPLQPKPTQGPPRPRLAGAARRQQPPEVARAAQRRPPQPVAPRQQHGLAAVMPLIDVPSAGRSSTTSRRQSAPLPPVDAFNTARVSQVKWSSPIKSDEDLNGRRVLPKASVLPQRSGLAGGRAGRPVPDTRASCAQTGISGTFFMKHKGEEEEGQEDEGGVEAELVQLSPEDAIAPARGSLLQHVPGGDCSDGDSRSDGSPQAAEEPAAAPATATMPSTAATSPEAPTASTMSSTAAPSLAPPPSRAESPGLQATDLAEENGDEEQGRELMMSMYVAGNPEEDKRELTNSTEGAAAAEEDDGEIGGEEEQGRELMMRIAAGGGTPPPAVSPAGEEQDETVPPSPPSAAESDDDGSSDLSSGEDEDEDAEMSSADERPPLIQWKTPKLTSAPAGGGGGGSGGGGGAGATSAKASSPNRSGAASATATVVHKPALTMRSHTRFGTSAAPPLLPGASTTGPLPLSYERSPQLPLSNGVLHSHQRLQDTNTMPAPPNPPPSSGGPPQRVAWKTPRQTAAPAAVTPTSSVDQQQEEHSEEQHDEDSSVELELPSEVVDALNPPAVQVLSTEVPSTSWRQPALAASRPARHQAQRHVVPPAASASPPSSVSSAAASPVSSARPEPMGRGRRPLPRFGAYPFRPPDERDSVPQGQLNTLSSSAKRLAASNVGAAVLPRQQQREASGRPEANGVPFDGRARGGEPSRPVVERRSTSSSSGPTSRESTSRSSSRSTNPSRQRRPDYSPRDEPGRNPRDGHGRGNEGGGHRDSSNRSNSSRVGPGGRMAGYHDRGDHPDVFRRGPRDGRVSGGYGYGNNNMEARGRGNGGRGGDHDFHPYRGRKPEKESGWGGFPDRRSEHNGNRPRGNQFRNRSRSPQRGRRTG